MPEDDLIFDPSIKLQPIDEFGVPPKSRRNVILYVAIAFGGVLSIVAILAIVGEVKRIRQSRGITVSVTAQRDPLDLRQESVAVFSNYDATDERKKVRSPEEVQERNEILELFRRVEACAAAQNSDDFHALVDFDRQLKRVELTGSLRGWSEFEKRSARTELKDSADLESFWGKITVVGIVQPLDDPQTRVVYTYASNPGGMELTEYRFWIGRVGNSWKLYDWARLDLGLSESEKWGMYAKYVNSPQMAGFQRWGEIIQEVDDLIRNDDPKRATEKLRLAESQLAPDGFQGYRWVLTGHRWMALSETSEAERCYNSVPQLDDTPGAYDGLMQCAQGRNAAEALKYAASYEAAVGPNPELSEAKAQLFDDLGRSSEAINEWKKLLRMDSANTSALIAVIRSLPKEDKAGLDPLFDRIEDPIEAVVTVAPSVAYRDYHRLPQLIEYLDRNAPAAAGTFYVKGLVKDLDGQYGEAAAFYRQAFETEKDEEKRGSYVGRYVEAMIAVGDVVEAWKKVPEPKKAFDNLFSSYEEGDTELTDDEYRQLLDLYQKQFPDDLGGIYRKAELDLSQDKYDDAEKLLRQGLRLANSNQEEESEYYRSSFANSLATVLVKRGKVKEAYESLGDQKGSFSSLVRVAVAEGRWKDVQLFIDTRAAQNPDDAILHYASGELAAHEKRWDDAIRHFQESLKPNDDEYKWLLKHRLKEIYIESGRWMEHYKSAEDGGDTFNLLANQFVSDKNWEALNTLIAEHTQQAADDIRIARHTADAAWAHEDYPAYIQRAQQVLAHNGANAVEYYERKSIEDRLLSAMLRNKQFDLARQFADTKQREKNDVSYLAIVNAAIGNWAESNRLAHVAAEKNESAASFYSSADFGRVFIGDHFKDLQRDFPVTLPYGATPTLAVLLLDQPLNIEVGEIVAALKDIGIESTSPPQPVKSTRKDITSAFAIPVGDGAVWIAAGKRQYFKRPHLGGDHATLLQAVNNSKSWLVVGVAGWRELDRKPADSVARRLSAQLTKGHSAVLWTQEEPWHGFSIYPVSTELMAAWQETGNLHAFSEQAASLTETEHPDVAANREFDAKLHEAVRSFESLPGARLEVVACIGGGDALDPLRLNVVTVRRSYGSLEFDGTLKNQSSLIPQLQEGLSMRFGSTAIKAWRLNDEAPIYRETQR